MLDDYSGCGEGNGSWIRATIPTNLVEKFAKTCNIKSSDFIPRTAVPCGWSALRAAVTSRS
jgi:hypothetical protein